jgi:phosphoribosylformimino-5-aminoimidazole carboxamide ribotide isomerase
MLIPSIDLMEGRIVQLVQGSRKELEFDNFQEWVDRFAKYPLVQLIDLDAAMGRGDNAALVRNFARQLPCQVGGGIRTVEAAEAALALGAHRVIVGSSLVANGAINTAFAAQLAGRFGAAKLVFAADSRGGNISIKGWKETTGIPTLKLLRILDSYCSAFLYTHIDTEGLLKGIPKDVVSELRGATSKQLIVAGGIRSQEEVDQLDALGADAVVGMAIYKGLMKA